MTHEHRRNALALLGRCPPFRNIETPFCSATLCRTRQGTGLCLSGLSRGSLGDPTDAAGFSKTNRRNRPVVSSHTHLETAPVTLHHIAIIGPDSVSGPVNRPHLGLSLRTPCNLAYPSCSTKLVVSDFGGPLALVTIPHFFCWQRPRCLSSRTACASSSRSRL